jgi:protein ImuA
MQPDFSSRFPLRRARVHEALGSSAMGFALMAFAALDGHLLWITEARHTDLPQPLGLTPFLDPARLLIAKTQTQIDSLAVAEEALKDGAANGGTLPFVVIEITRPLDLREGRRLQLAAKAGGTTGLCLITEGMGSNAAETRWRATSVFDPATEDSTLMRWEIIKNKSGTLGAWNVQWNPQTRRVHVVPSVGERPGFTGAAN